MLGRYSCNITGPVIYLGTRIQQILDSIESILKRVIVAFRARRREEVQEDKHGPCMSCSQPTNHLVPRSPGFLGPPPRLSPVQKPELPQFRHKSTCLKKESRPVPWKMIHELRLVLYKTEDECVDFVNACAREDLERGRKDVHISHVPTF